MPSSIAIKRAGAPVTTVATVPIDERTVLTHALMNEHKVTLITLVAAPIALKLGDYIEVGSAKYYINRSPQVELTSDKLGYEYTITFEAEVYNLYNKLFLDEGASDFSYYGTAEDMLDLLVTNINSISSGWSTGTVAATTAKTVAFAGDNCRTALTRIAEVFGMEYSLAGRVISMVAKVGSSTEYAFEYGKGKGLYQLTRSAVEDKDVITRVFGFGAAKNINFDYRDGAKRLVFEDQYVEANTLIYGVREGVYTNDEIFPQRTGSATAVSNNVGTGVFTITDSTIDFDINDYLLEGLTAKIVFKTGALAGYSFEILSYDHATKVIRYAKFIEQDDYELPNALNYAEVDDEYTLIDINMPESYITTAEDALEAATLAYLNENSSPRVLYGLTLDPKYVLVNNVALAVGDELNVVDTALGIDADVRVVEISYPLAFPYKVSVTLSDSVLYYYEDRTYALAVEAKRGVSQVSTRSQELARQNTLRMRQLQGLIYDPDGYFDTDNIRPQSIETLMLSVGAKSQNFSLNNVAIEANYTGDPAKLRITAGSLVHFEIEIDGMGNVWAMAAQTFSTLVDATTYYLYAKCSDSALTGVWVISDTPLLVDHEAGYYHFYTGILFPEASGSRYFNFTKGMTFIVGDTITTGKIQSLDGLTYFDLSNGTFKAGDGSQSIDWGVTEAGKLTINGAIIADAVMSDFIMAELAYIDDLGVRTLKTADSGQRLEISADDNNLIFYDEDDNEVLRVDDSVATDESDDPLPGIIVGDPATDKRVIITSEGVTAYGHGPYTENIRGSIEGFLTKNPGSLFQAGVVGLDKRTGTKTGEGFGGLFNTALIQGLFLGSVNAIISSVTVTNDEQATLFYCKNTSAINFTLPASPIVGRVFFIKQCDANVTLVGGTKQFFTGDPAGTSYTIGDNGIMVMIQYDGTYWQLNKLL